MSLQQQLDRLLKGYYDENDLNEQTEGSQHSGKRPEYLDFGTHVHQDGVLKPPPPPPPPSDRPHTPPREDLTEDAGGQQRNSVPVSSSIAPDNYAEHLRNKLQQGQRLTPRERKLMKELRQQLVQRRQMLQEQLHSVSRLRTEREREFLRYQALDRSRASELQSTPGSARQSLDAEVAPLELPSRAEFQHSLDSLEKLGNDAGSPNITRPVAHSVSPERKEMDPLAHSHWVLYQASREVQQRKHTEATAKQMAEHLDNVLRQKRESIQAKRDELHNLYNRILELSHNLNVANERVTQRDLELLEARQKLAKLVKATQELVQLSKEYENAGGVVQFSSNHALEDLATALSSVTESASHPYGGAYGESHSSGNGSTTSTGLSASRYTAMTTDSTPTQTTHSTSSHVLSSQNVSWEDDKHGPIQGDEHPGESSAPVVSPQSLRTFQRKLRASNSNASGEETSIRDVRNGAPVPAHDRFDFDRIPSPHTHGMDSHASKPQTTSTTSSYSSDRDRVQSLVAASEHVLTEARKFSPRAKQ
eukprot:gb/GECG01016147.1/.p1 GENE.gb/GECG01016147.1/~~gb/GECG01016147.1/.p1  ORF type:complete len:534 (+),score=80.25 gb/GECG01016147.1/:1-1602(+)